MVATRKLQPATPDASPRLWCLLEESPEAVLQIGAAGRLLYANPAARALHPNLAGRARGRVPPTWRAGIRAALKSGRVQEWEVKQGERVLLCRASPAPAHRCVNVHVRDITQHRQTEETLAYELNLMNELMNAIPDHIYFKDRQSRFLRVNTEKILRSHLTSPEQILGKTDFDFFSAEHARQAFADEQRIIRTGRPIIGLEEKETWPDGSVTWVHTNKAALRDKNGGIIGTFGISRDITRQKELQREILAISEREQRRLGHDLHDDLCQQLAGIEFLSQTLASRLAGQVPEAAAQLREIASLVRNAMGQTRDMAHGLAPVDLESEGLADALRKLAAQTRNVFRRKCRFHSGTAVALPEDAAGIHLYRIAQEAVSNAIKHGKARSIVIQLTARAGGISLAVRDNGAGLPKKFDTYKGKGMGLRIMQYRAGLIGGQLAIRRNRHGGTTVTCTIAGKPPSKRNGH